MSDWKDALRLAAAVLIGLLIGWVLWKAGLATNPCYDGTPIAETPNYCMYWTRR